MNRFTSSLAAQSSFGYLLVRLLVGVILAISGYNKVFVMGMDGASAFFEKIGIPLAMLAGPVVSLLELIGGLLLIVGLFTRYVAVLFFIEFIVAAWAKWLPMNQGYAGARLDMLILVSALLFATNGAGSISVDAKLGRG